MTEEAKKSLKIVGYVALVLVAAAGVGLGVHTYTSKASAYNCKAEGNEICASQSFYEDYLRWKALREEISADQKSAAVRGFQDKADLFNGMTTRLNGAMPKGYGWDEQKLKFTPTPIPPTPAPVAPAASTINSSPVDIKK